MQIILIEQICNFTKIISELIKFVDGRYKGQLMRLRGIYKPSGFKLE